MILVITLTFLASLKLPAKVRGRYGRWLLELGRGLTREECSRISS
jgi:hypothetical protein